MPRIALIPPAKAGPELSDDDVEGIHPRPNDPLDALVFAIAVCNAFERVDRLLAEPVAPEAPLQEE